MSDLTTLDGISEARDQLYRDLIEGKMSEQRANIADRILRGQTILKGDLPLKALNMITRMKSTGGEEFQQRLMGIIARNMGPKALTE